MDGNNNSAAANDEEAEEVVSSSVSDGPELKLTPKQNFEKFLSSQEKDVRLFSKSPVATYSNPRNWYQNLINILNVAFDAKTKDLSTDSSGLSKDCTSGSCVVTSKYKDLESKKLPLDEIKQLFHRAKTNFEKDKNIKQSTITSFFQRAKKVVPIPQEFVCEEGNHVAMEQARVMSPVNRDEGANLNFSTISRKEVFRIFSVSFKDSENIVDALKLDLEIIKSDKPVALVKQFYELYAEVEKKKFYDQKKGTFAEEKSQVLQTLDEIKEQFQRLAYLSDKEKRGEDAKKLDFEEIPDFFAKNREEVQRVGKGLFLRLNSPPFSSSLSKVIIKLQKRISNLNKISESANGELVTTCSNAGFTWSECLSKIEEDGWIPSHKNGNIFYEDFEKCHDIFISMQRDGQEFITGETLLQWLNKSERKMQCLKTLVENLPIIKFVRFGTIILVAVETFMSSSSMITDFIEIVRQDENKVPDVEVIEGTVPQLPSKEGRSGRTRLVDQNPEILETIRTYAESSGISAHNRRHESTGRFGFNIEDVQKVLKNKFFSNNPEKCLSLATIRRTFEAPSQARKSKSYYKGDIPCRPASKKNDAPGNGVIHPHRHQCSSFVKSVKELFFLFEDECTVISADNKAKIGIGIPCVNRLTDLSQKFFMTGQGPNYPDHDVNRTGHLIVPEGYLILTSKPDQDTSSDDTDPESSTRHVDRGVGPSDHPKSSTAECNVDCGDGDNSCTGIRTGTFERTDSWSPPASPTPSEIERWTMEKSAPNEDELEILSNNNSEDERLSNVSNDEEKLSNQINNERLSKVHTDAGIIEDDSEVEEESKPLSQLDGNNSSDYSSDEGFTPPAMKRPRVESDSESTENEENEANLSTSTEEDQSSDDSDSGELNEYRRDLLQRLQSKVIHDQYGRAHIKVPRTGPSLVFYKSNRAKPSTISRHVDDILTLMEAMPEIKAKTKNLNLVVDDGCDWSGRSLQTFYWLGVLWMKLGLDVLILSRFAPGDSKWNDIESEWGPHTKKIVGKVLAAITQDEDVDAAEDRSIKELINDCLKDLEYDGYPVHSIHVPCTSNEVIINDQVYKNEHCSQEEATVVQDIFEHQRYTKRVIAAEHPEISTNLKLFYKHCDARLHSFTFRKCHPEEYQCKYCQKNPVRSSDGFWKSLLPRSHGGLVFDVEVDDERPDHYKTFLQMRSNRGPIQADGMFDDINRCKEKNCFWTFKSSADATRHMRIAHDSNSNPLGYTCNWLIDGVRCGQVFQKKWDLTKHKNTLGHKKTTVKN